MTKENGKPGPGGKREGAGRPPGARGKAVLEREDKARRIVDDIMSRLSPEEQETIGPLEVGMLIMRIHLLNRDLPAALSAASVVLPFTNAKKAASNPILTLERDLLPDVDQPPDEPGPANPRL